MIPAAAAGAGLASVLLVFTCYRTLSRRAFSLFDLLVVVVAFTNAAAVGAMAILKWADRAFESRLLWFGALALAMTPCLRGAGWAVEQVARQRIVGALPRAGWIAAGFLVFPACVLACGLPAEVAMMFAPRVHEHLWVAILASGLSAMLLVHAYTLHRRGRRLSQVAPRAGDSPPPGETVPRTRPAG